MAVSFFAWGIAALIGYLVYNYAFGQAERLPLPPGPRPLPIVGNVRDVPPAGVPEFEHWLKHKDIYGPVSSVTILGMTLVIINDQKAAHDLLEQAASKTSGRPTNVFANKLCGFESIVLCQGYNTTFRRYRKLLHRELGTKASAAQFRGAQEVEVNRQLVRGLREPGKWLEHLQTTSAASTLRMTYGYNIDPNNPDTLVALIERMMTEFSQAAVPFSWVVDLIPALQYLPESFPGAGFKKTARAWRESILSCAHIPYQFVREQMEAGTNRPSYVSRHIEQCAAEGPGNAGLSREDEDAIVWTAASLYGAAADTSVISLTSFTMAMVLFPRVQQKTQEEIDRVIGIDRLPTFDDRDSLPYVNALVKETLRWWPIAPMGFPHAAEHDFEYNGMRIPKDATFLPSIWWFLHDPETYTDPHSFDPDRFLAPRNEPDPATEAFGYGRRICAGRDFADASLYINIVQSLAAFSFSKAVDGCGREIEIDTRVKPGVLSYPTQFQFRLTPRSSQHVDLIQRLEIKHPFEEGDSQLLG